MRITPIFVNQINNKKYSQDISFGYGVSITKYGGALEKRNRSNRAKLILIDRIERYLSKQKSELVKIVDKIKGEKAANEDYMPTIGLRVQLKGAVVPEVAVEVKGIEDKKPVVISEWVLIKEGWSTDKNSELAVAVEAKARESAEIAKAVANRI